MRFGQSEGRAAGAALDSLAEKQPASPADGEQATFQLGKSKDRNSNARQTGRGRARARLAVVASAGSRPSQPISKHRQPQPPRLSRAKPFRRRSRMNRRRRSPYKERHKLTPKHTPRSSTTHSNR